jgi:hypothetical protein
LIAWPGLSRYKVAGSAGALLRDTKAYERDIQYKT